VLEAIAWWLFTLPMYSYYLVKAWLDQRRVKRGLKLLDAEQKNDRDDRIKHPEKYRGKE
jgi:hypothetical protein